MIRVEHGDCRTVMLDLLLEGVQVSSICTDPPYHLTEVPHVPPGGFGGQRSDAKRAARGGFMNAKWDGGSISFDPQTWRLAYDLLEPGGMLAAFGGSRTHHRIMCAIEDAGFEIRDCLLWLHSQGFPKSKALLKPSYEPIILARKPGPLRPLAIDACRVGTSKDVPASSSDAPNNVFGASSARKDGRDGMNPNIGRWPPNLAHDNSPEVLAAFARFGTSKSSGGGMRNADKFGGGFAPPGVRNIGLGDTGTAARYFPALGYDEDELRFHYCAKAGKADRAGSRHPTVKPTSLVEWVTKLISPPGSLVLDPFAGSGTLATAAHRLGMDAILIEQDAGYVKDIEVRIAGLRPCP